MFRKLILDITLLISKQSIPLLARLGKLQSTPAIIPIFGIKYQIGTQILMISIMDY